MAQFVDTKAARQASKQHERHQSKKKGQAVKFMEIKNYLKEKIDNSWYKNAFIDYGISGSFIDAKEIGHNLKIIWEEMGEPFEMVIPWFQDYTLEQLYNIWMEG